ncbi:MAG: LysM peptidoglycan-binding domain-containing protein [Deltaproteobacteria bacterium]|nr:LysM peptidoglycan-binding domain-containing protein [Deltaproteobacteria bacterium]
MRKDDSLAILAAEYYGDHTKQIFIMVENGMTHARPLKPGETLRIPIAREIIAKEGDTFTSIAGAYYGEKLAKSRGEVIAEYNGMGKADTLTAGTTLALPFAVRHTAAGVESTAQISLAYFGDASHAERIRVYNNLDANATLQKGEQIYVPVFSVRLRPDKLPKLDADSEGRRARRKAAVEKAATAIPTARQAWRAGDFNAVKAALADLDAQVEYLDAAAAIDVGMLLGSVHVAANDTELAVAAFKRVLARKPGMKLRPFDHSPKVIDAWTKAGGQAE